MISSVKVISLQYKRGHFNLGETGHYYLGATVEPESLVNGVCFHYHCPLAYRGQAMVFLPSARRGQR